jgi:hypothetical protein
MTIIAKKGYTDVNANVEVIIPGEGIEVSTNASPTSPMVSVLHDGTLLTTTDHKLSVNPDGLNVVKSVKNADNSIEILGTDLNPTVKVINDGKTIKTSQTGVYVPIDNITLKYDDRTETLRATTGGGGNVLTLPTTTISRKLSELRSTLIEYESSRMLIGKLTINISDAGVLTTGLDLDISLVANSDITIDFGGTVLSNGEYNFNFGNSNVIIRALRMDTGITAAGKSITFNACEFRGAPIFRSVATTVILGADCDFRPLTGVGSFIEVSPESTLIFKGNNAAFLPASETFTTNKFILNYGKVSFPYLTATQVNRNTIVNYGILSYADGMSSNGDITVNISSMTALRDYLAGLPDRLDSNVLINYSSPTVVEETIDVAFRCEKRGSGSITLMCDNNYNCRNLTITSAVPVIIDGLSTRGTIIGNNLTTIQPAGGYTGSYVYPMNVVLANQLNCRRTEAASGSSYSRITVRGAFTNVDLSYYFLDGVPTTAAHSMPQLLVEYGARLTIEELFNFQGTSTYDKTLEANYSGIININKRYSFDGYTIQKATYNGQLWLSATTSGFKVEYGQVIASPVLTEEKKAKKEKK